jgi:hypothetical protein
MLTIIWFGGSSSFYVTLSPAGGEEQALVDTLFPAVSPALWGRRVGIGRLNAGERGRGRFLLELSRD